MEREKVVVVLLMITIILSIVSVVLTLTVSPVAASDSGTTVVQDPDDSGTGQIGFEIITPEDTAAEGGAS